MSRNFVAALLVGMFCATHVLRAESPEKGVALSVQISPRTDDGGGMMPVEPGHIAQTADAVRKRLVAMGYSKIRIADKTAIGFQIHIADVDRAKASGIASALRKSGRLELKEVSPRSEETAADGRTLARRVMDGDEIVPGYRAHMLTARDGEGNEHLRPILLNRRTAITSSDIELAAPSPQHDEAVWVTLNNEGTDKMIALTKNMRPGRDRVAILLDGEVISAPVVQQVPLGKNFIIEGLREPGEAENLADSLMNPLEFPILVEELPPMPVTVKPE